MIDYYYLRKTNKEICEFNTPIKKFIKKLNNSKYLFQIIIDENKKYIGTVTDGDLRRFLIKYDINQKNLKKLINTKSIYGYINDDKKNIEKIKKLSKVTRSLIDFIPILDSNKIVKKILILDKNYKLNNFACFIFAGGKGKRMRSLNTVLPKPLLKINNSTLLDKTIKKISNTGINNFFLSINYKKNLIKKNLQSKFSNKFNIEFVEEINFLGTAGSLHLVKNKNFEHFLVMNCDVVTNLELSSFIEYYLSTNFDVLIGASIIKYNIPYGVINETEGKFLNIHEKPDKSFKVSSGIYIFRKENFSLIKANKYLDMPKFLSDLSAKKKNIGIFPIYEKWLDVGTPKSLIEGKKNFK
ncbi:MAG: hypothetical protein CMI90_05235 [Pelagibacteraceae bacterium]|nr:hypothetical protein [Pelagibacteraceae bacterium]